MSRYDQSWHSKLSAKTEESARRILPHIIGTFRPSSCLDVGCGLGHWTKAAIDFGVGEALGVDGSWASTEDMLIPCDNFTVADLDLPLKLDRRFDVALTLEVAEHVRESSADIFVESLVRHSDLIVFSAAIPMQGGGNHINEQWPSYWIPKFSSHRFRAFDILRPIFWTDDLIYHWYRQNMLVFINENRLDLIETATAELIRIAQAYPPMDLVHPEMFKPVATYEYIAMRRLVPRLPKAAWGAAYYHALTLLLKLLPPAPRRVLQKASHILSS